MSEPGLKLTVYFAERDRVGRRFLADALGDLYERHEILASILLRGAAGFGDRHGLHSELSLTLSESLPAVLVAVDTRERIERALPEVLELAAHGLVSVERAELVDVERPELVTARLHELPAADTGAAVKLTLYGGGGSQDRGSGGGRAAGYGAALELLRASGAAAGFVLLGVDGTVRRERRRARFFARNAGVPLMLTALGDRASVAAAWPQLSGLLGDPVATVERVELCRADGRTIASPRSPRDRDDAGRPIWQQLTVHSRADARHDGHPLHLGLLRALREAGGTGATMLRGVRGFYGETGPFADRMLSLQRRAPLQTVIVERPDGIRRIWPVVESLTAQAGLVTSELVPAFHRGTAAPAPGTRAALARIWE